jgi:hypothetical protein
MRHQTESTCRESGILIGSFLFWWAPDRSGVPPVWVPRQVVVDQHTPIED